MTQRLFVPARIEGGRVQLAGAEAHHLLDVMRAQLGSEWILFDGFGSEFRARLQAVGKRTAELEILEQMTISRESPLQLQLAVALPKGDRQKWLIEKCVELGVHTLTPLVTARAVIKGSENSLEKLRRYVIEASKQCGRNLLMEIKPAQSFEQLVSKVNHTTRWIAEPQGQSIRTLTVSHEAVATVMIGPEGGFAGDELKRGEEHGWAIVSLGPRTLRIETAAVAMAAYFAGRG
jgi:16S rRNA (uracil1498-N3)-methyltransferase